MVRRTYLFSLCAKLLGLLLILAALSKISDLSAFKAYLDALDVLPLFVRDLVLFFLPCTELIVGLGLLTKFAYGQTQVFALLLFGAFFLFSIVSLLTSAPPCHCFQAQGLEKLFDSGIGLVTRNLIFFVMSIFAFFHTRMEGNGDARIEANIPQTKLEIGALA